MYIFAVDPGDEYVGIAEWEAGAIRAREVSAAEWLPQFAGMVSRQDVVVIEDFRLFPSRAVAQSYSKMKTSKMIGAMEWIASSAEATIVVQSPNVKTPTRQQCKARGINVKHKSIHASDALLHLHHYLLRNDLEV